jgi:ATP-binding cassette subfamily C (CFTR/MRP) protein 1
MRKWLSNNSSGKSTLLLTLLRLLDLQSGTIKIDSIDISTVPRALLRSRLTTIPQDPFILNSSVRVNADPSETRADADIIAALERVKLWETISSRGGLDVLMKGQPLSHGQEQLFCLARAMLGRRRAAKGDGEEGGKDTITGRGILVLDEATSNVDEQTDILMRGVIREEFAGYTILTIAHRMETILDSDVVAVLDRGKLVGFGPPGEVLQDKGEGRLMSE